MERLPSFPQDLGDPERLGVASGGCWPKPGDNQKNSFQKTLSGSYNEHLPRTWHVGPTTDKPQSGDHYRMAHLRCWML